MLTKHDLMCAPVPSLISRPPQQGGRSVPPSPHPTSAVKHSGISDGLTMPASTTGLGMDIASDVMTLEGRSADTCPTSTASRRTRSFGPNFRRRTRRSKRGSRAPFCSRAAKRRCWWACRGSKGQSQPTADLAARILTAGDRFTVGRRPLPCSRAAQRCVVGL